eukprot:4248897-Pleurochrysis_carterae.AAC.4
MALNVGKVSSFPSRYAVPESRGANCAMAACMPDSPCMGYVRTCKSATVTKFPNRAMDKTFARRHVVFWSQIAALLSTFWQSRKLPDANRSKTKQLSQLLCSRAWCK